MISNLVVALDRNVLWGCAVTIRSALEHISSARRTRVFVLYEGLSEAERDALSASWEFTDRDVDISFVNIEMSKLTALVRSKNLSRMSFARLLIGDLLPAEVDRCIYLDSDMIVERDLGELFDLDLEGCTIGAVPDGDHDWDRVQLGRLGIDRGRYVNAGFFVADLRLWRASSVGARAMSFCLGREPRLVGWMKQEPFFHDQDGLNYVLARDGTFILPSHWNVWASRSTPSTEKLVTHLIMGRKPWEVDYDGQYAAKFFSYLDRTAFKGNRPKRGSRFALLIARVRRRIPYPPTVLRLLVASIRQFWLRR